MQTPEPMPERTRGPRTVTARDRLVVDLGGPGPRLDASIGRKAATLARLSRAGFLIPESVVLTAEAFSQSGALPAPVEAAIAEIAGTFGDATLAVRSSSALEDQPTASYAGQYETTLGVRGEGQLPTAIRCSWESAGGGRVQAYTGRAARPAPIAVLVQRQLVPDVAGVAFTADPVTGDRSRVLVSAVPGLGDSVAGGTSTPDEWVVGEDAAPVRAVPCAER